MLVEAGADINARTEAGDTALMVAARRAGAARVVGYCSTKEPTLRPRRKTAPRLCIARPSAATWRCSIDPARQFSFGLKLLF